MQRLYLFLIYFFCSHFCSYSQLPSGFLLYGVKDGLSQNSVHAVFKDRDGLVWIGTQDGLNSFDGKHFTVYRYNENDTNSISDQFILNIQEDKKGNLWIGTRNGLNCFNKRTQKFTRIYVTAAEKHTFQSAYFDFFIQDDNSVVVYKDGVYVIEGASGKSKKLRSPSDKRTNWFITPTHKAWVIDEDNRFFFCADIRNNHFTDFGISPFGTEDYSQFSAVPYKDSFLFVYNKNTVDEIIIFDTHTQSVKQKIKLPVNITHLDVISPEEIIISATKGIYKTGISGNAQMLFTGGGNSNSLPPGPVLTTYKDAGGNLWIGTSGKGVAVSNASFANFQLIKPPLQNDVICCIAKHGTTIYAGTRSGLYKMESFSGVNVSGKFSLVYGKGITAVAVDKNQNIWAAVPGEGIHVISSKGSLLNIFSLPGAGAGTTVLYMGTDRTGRIMIGTTAGFFVATSSTLPPVKFSVTEKGKELCGDYVMSAFEDRDKNIWVAENEGLDVFNGSLIKKKSFKSSDDKSSFLKRTIITSVTQDKNGVMWIATIRGGIYKFNGSSYTRYTASSGLASDVVYNLMCDEQNRIWATTSAGLCVFNNTTNSFIALTASDGVPAAEYVFGAALQIDNYLLLGTSEGLLICNTAGLKLPAGNINAFISDVKVNGSSIDVQNYRFEIIPDGKLITFDFSSSPAFFSGNIIYQYRLSGLHENWITLPQGIHTVSYTGLPYKDLSMEVRAAVSLNNLASAPVNNIFIKSKAPFWKTTAFILTAVFLFILLVIFVSRDYNKKKYKKQLQQLLVEKGLREERTRIGRDLHDNIGAYTSALIAGLSHIQSANREQEKHVSDLKEYGSNIMGFLRETIWMLNSEILTITAFADRFKNYALRISKNYPGIDFQFTEEIAQDKTLPPTLMLNVFRILQEALQNACKHSGASVIIISVRNVSKLYFEVKDNGKGFGDKNEAENYGLNNMKQRASESGFMLNISTGQDGTMVSIKQNTANAALNAAEETV